jgi:hypothetical protein
VSFRKNHQKKIEQQDPKIIREKKSWKKKISVLFGIDSENPKKIRSKKIIIPYPVTNQTEGRRDTIKLHVLRVGIHLVVGLMEGQAIPV